jgi:hypothetical protein
MTTNALLGTPLAHHEAGNPYCPACDRSDLVFPIPCSCGGLIHRDAESSVTAAYHYDEICDACGGKETDELL